MGIKNMIKKSAQKAGDGVAKLSSLSPAQLEEVAKNRDKYLSEMPDLKGKEAEELTNRLLGTIAVEIYNAYLPQLKELYVPVDNETEYEEPFSPAHNIRYFNITKWVNDKKEKNLEKLVNIYEVLSCEECNIALVFNRTCKGTEVYLAVVNTKNTADNVDVENYRARIADAIKGNFPGAEWKSEKGIGKLPCLDNNKPYSVATVSNVPTEKSEKFISQTIEKLLDGIVPDKMEKEYTLVLLATPILDIQQRKIKLAEMYTGLVPYSTWQTNFTFTESNANSSSATFGVNVGVSAGKQTGQNASDTTSSGVTDSENGTNTDTVGKAESDTAGETNTKSDTHTKGKEDSKTKTGGVSVTAGATAGVSGVVSVNSSVTGSLSLAKSSGTNESDSIAKSTAKTASKTLTNNTSKAIAKSLGKAVSKTVSKTSGVFQSINLGVNFGANFARSSNVTATVGKNEGISQTFINYNIKHTLEILEDQMKRLEQSTALGMWDFAAYVLSEDYNVANNVAHTYLALTQGEESYTSQTSVNLWRGDQGANSGDAREISSYIKQLRHPLFGLNPDVVYKDPTFNLYPTLVNATTSLSGKELAYSLNFPQHSVSGFPVLECTEFGRNIVTYDESFNDSEKLNLGKVFHMNHSENTTVYISKKSLSSHTFVTGSTGSGKSNTVYQLINKAKKTGAKFLVIEPAKGEYKHIFGSDKNVFVYGTNPYKTPMLRLNPFSFPDEIHILEHLDRLVEIFNVCWPMYAAMPAVLKNAIEKAYTDCGWDLCTSRNIYEEKLYPCFADVAENISIIIEQSEYDSENKGAYKGALKTRLKSLTNGINGMIFVQDEISSQQLFDENVIVDLSRVGSAETKSLIMGIIILKLQEYRMSTSSDINLDLKHITVLEEAHNILKRTSTEQISESSNLIGKSVEMISNSIAEMRSYGEGFIIVDQAPGLLDMSVIRNTNTKIIMRLPDQSDRELVGKAANLSDDQITELAKLPCGVGAVYQNEWIQPVLCKIDKFNENEKSYNYSPEEYDYKFTEKTSVSLLDCIMNKEIFRKGDKEDIKALKDIVLSSNLKTTVKCDFIDYINSNEENTFKSLRVLVYDFLSASEAIKKSQSYSNLNDWINSVVNEMNPTIKGYSQNQIDLVIALVLYEQANRNNEYINIFCKYTEKLESNGGVFKWK